MARKLAFLGLIVLACGGSWGCCGRRWGNNWCDPCCCQSQPQCCYAPSTTGAVASTYYSDNGTAVATQVQEPTLARPKTERR